MNNEGRKAHLVGLGIATLAAAAYLMKDGGFSGAKISIYEEESLPGGALDAAGTPEKGYFMRGGAHVRGELRLHVRSAFFHPFTG